MTLDIALGGGFPKGRIVELGVSIPCLQLGKEMGCLHATWLHVLFDVQVFGPESSGKTTLAMHAIAEVQRQGGTAALIDAEHAFDPVYSKVSVFDTVPH
jgi:recombination protein RecA